MAYSQASSPICLLLTATIQVDKGMVFTERKDTNTRLGDYKKALALWLAQPQVTSIVLVENSGADLSALIQLTEAMPGTRVEFLSFTAPLFDASLGKGYGEMLCLQHALEHSRLLIESSRVLKVTGRYYLANATELLRFFAVQSDAEIICDLLLNLTWADSRAFVATPSFLRNCLFPLRDQLNDSRASNFEHILARAVHACMANGGIWMQPPFPLQIEGVSGSQDRDWRPTLGQRLKRRIRQRLFARFLGTGPA